MNLIFFQALLVTWSDLFPKGQGGGGHDHGNDGNGVMEQEQ